jgi:hypothetical protein
MLKQKTVIEIVKDQRVYSLALCPESPLPDVYEVLNQMRNYVIERIETAKKNEEEMEAKAEVEKVEVK